MKYLSPSKLNVLKDCPRCFWDTEAAGLPKPRGIFPSLPGGMDLVMKPYFDQFAGSVTPQIEGKVDSKIVLDKDLNGMTRKQMRHWRTGPNIIFQDIGVTLRGALDDCLFGVDGYSPFDYKTRGSEPKDDGSQYYQWQLDCYDLMLDKNGMKTTGYGYLLYFWPNIIQKSVGGALEIQFLSKLFKIKTSKDNAMEIVYRSAKILEGSRPEPDPACEHCGYLEKYQKKFFEK